MPMAWPLGLVSHFKSPNC